MRSTLPHKRFAPLPLALAAAVTLALAAGPMPQAHAQSSPPAAAAPVQIDIQAQALGAALNELARQAHLQMSFPAALVAGKKAPAVQGRMTAREALDRLLADSGLVAELNAGQAVVKPVTAGQPEATLPAVRVSGQSYAETATGPVVGYAAKRSATATRTDVALIDTPVSVQTIGRELIDDQKAMTLSDALSNVSGVFVAHGPDGNTMDAFNVRGFQVDSYGASYMDGVKDFSRSPKEMAGLERIEILKGPAAIMYGRIEPGGMINRVSKRPQAEGFTAVEQTIGTDRHFRTTLDSTGALNEQSSWLYRVNLVSVDEDGFKDDTHNRRIYAAPQLEWRPSAATTVRAGIDYLKEKRSWALTYGTIGDENGPVDIPISTNLHGKDDHYREESATLKVEWMHKLDPNWQLQQRLSYGRRNSAARGSWLSDAELNGDYTRVFWGWEGEKSKVVSTNLEVQGKLQGPLGKHTLLAGVDYFDEDYDSGGWAWGGTEVDSNVHNPVYDDDYRDDYGVDPFAYRNRNVGLFVQDQIAMLDERLHLLLGIRRDKAEYGSLYGVGSAEMVAKDEKNTWRAGLLYKLQPELSVYASYVTGFGSSQFDWSTGTSLPPQTSKQMELGVKYQTEEGFNLSVTAFQLVKDNLTMADPADPLRTILAGEARSRGLEVDAAGRIGSSFDVVASYTYTDVRYTRSDSMQGERLMGVPRHGASLWGTYRLAGTGWRMGAGLVHRTSILGTQRAWSPDLYPYTLDGYTLVNAMVGYDFRLAGYEARAQLNADNLTDKRYNPTTYGGSTRIGLGEPRKILASLRLQF